MSAVKVSFSVCVCVCVTHSVGPVSEVPVGYTWPHVALLTPQWPSTGAAILVVHDVALIADAAHTPSPPPDSTVY